MYDSINDQKDLIGWQFEPIFKINPISEKVEFNKMWYYFEFVINFSKFLQKSFKLLKNNKKVLKTFNKKNKLQKNKTTHSSPHEFTKTSFLEASISSKSFKTRKWCRFYNNDG